MKNSDAGIGRRGMSLVELLIALTIFTVIVASALQFIATQNSAFREGIERSTALRAARFTIRTLETDLSTLGTNLAPGQPGLVYADEDVIAFNADYATNVAGDPFAVFHDPDAPGGQVTAPTTATAIPNSAVSHPDTTYWMGGSVSPAELLIFFFTPDSSTTRTDDFVLLRQVNAEEPELIASDLLRADGMPFFRYLRLDGSSVDSIPDADLPVRHVEPVHLSPADTGALAVVDSIRGVRVTVRGTNGRTGDGERTGDMTRIIRFPNAGTTTATACGDTPILGVTPTASERELATGEWVVDLAWNPATDESGGEGDVIRYVLWRRLSGSPDWGDPYLSIPAGQASYTYTDAAVQSGTTYEYGLGAQDCTPTLSDLAATSPVTIP